MGYFLFDVVFWFVRDVAYVRSRQWMAIWPSHYVASLGDTAVRDPRQRAYIMSGRDKPPVVAVFLVVFDQKVG